MTPQRKRRQRKRHPANSGGVAILGIRYDPPDIHKFAKVIVSLAATAMQDEDAPANDSFHARESNVAPEEQQIDHAGAA